MVARCTPGLPGVRQGPRAAGAALRLGGLRQHRQGADPLHWWCGAPTRPTVVTGRRHWVRPDVLLGSFVHVIGVGALLGHSLGVRCCLLAQRSPLHSSGVRGGPPRAPGPPRTPQHCTAS